jgi:Zn-dependent peptidase ImmA (M78 family)
VPIDWTQIKIPFLSDEEIRKRADEFRLQHWGDRIPVDIELIIERNLDLLIIPIEQLRYHAHTDAYLSGDLKEIVYDPSLPDNRVRFSIAHEIGHYVLHRNIIAMLHTKSFEEWKQLQREIPEAIWGRAEYQAREFAGRLLVPPQKLIEALRQLKSLIESAQKAVPDLELPVLIEFVAPKLANVFQVSADVIMKRLDAEAISPVQE